MLLVRPRYEAVIAAGEGHVLYGVCRPLEEEGSFCLGLSTRPVSEVVFEGLIPRFLDLITLL